MTNTLHQEEVPNSLGEETGWGMHESFVVALSNNSTYNSTRVVGVISIIAPESEADLEEWRENQDLDDLISGDQIQTTANGARALAAALIRAADLADESANVSASEAN